MADLFAVLTERLAPAFAAVAGATDVDPVVRPSDRADAQANGALALAKRLGRNPRDVAGDVVAAADLDGVADGGDRRSRLHQPDGRHVVAQHDARRRRRRRPARRRPPTDAAATSSTTRRRTSPRSCTSATCAAPSSATPLVRMLDVPRPRRRPREPHRRLGSTVRHPHRAARRDRCRERRRLDARRTPGSCTRRRRRGSPTIPSSPSGRGPGSSSLQRREPETMAVWRRLVELSEAHWQERLRQARRPAHRRRRGGGELLPGPHADGDRAPRRRRAAAGVRRRPGRVPAGVHQPRRRAAAADRAQQRRRVHVRHE